MSIEVKDINDGLGAVIISAGIVSSDDFVNALTAHLTQDDEKMKKYAFFISDYSEATQIDVTADDLKIVAALSINASQVNPNIISAIIAGSDLVFGLSRMAMVYKEASNWEKEVFRDKHEALQFIVDSSDELESIEELVW